MGSVEAFDVLNYVRPSPTYVNVPLPKLCHLLDAFVHPNGSRENPLVIVIREHSEPAIKEHLPTTGVATSLAMSGFP